MPGVLKQKRKVQAFKKFTWVSFIGINCEDPQSSKVFLHKLKKERCQYPKQTEHAGRAVSDLTCLPAIKTRIIFKGHVSW